MGAQGTTGTINFGSASGSTKIEGKYSSGSGTVTYTDTGTDSQGNTWTITTVTKNDKSFTQNAAYSQIGASSKPVTSITFTTTLANDVNITAFSAKFGGFSGTAGTITLKVGDTSVGTGSLNASSDVTVSSTSSAVGKVLTVTVTGISKGVKAYYISYTYEAAATLTGITVDTPPTKTSYKIDETLDLSGIKVIASYDNETTKDVTSQCTFNPANGSSFNTTGNQNISITYQEKSATQSITVYGVTALTVKTAPTKIAYKETEQLDLSGLVLTATYSNNETKDITEGFTSSIDDDTALTTSNTSVKFTYYGKEVDQAISVGTLSSITYNNSGDGAFANTTYTEKDKFNPSGLVVTAHYSNGINEVVTGYSLSPDADTELQTTNNKVVVSFTWAETTKTVDIPITVIAGTKYTVTFNAQTGTCGTTSLTETEYMSGVTMPEASCSKDGWDFAGWATAPVTNTMTAPTLYPTGSTYYPTENTTLYAVYCCTDGDVTKLTRATSVEQILSAPTIAIVNGGKILKSDFSISTAPSDNNGISKADDIIWTLTGNDTDGYTITNGSITVGAEGLTNAQLKNTTTYCHWIVEQSTYSSNVFVFRLKESPNNGCIEYYSSDNKWKVYTSGSNFSYLGNQYVACKVYTSARFAYNSNPAALITPEVVFEKGNTTLYLDGTKTYTNEASVSNVTKTITYKSSDTNVATVDDEGVVTAKAIGEAIITASVPAELGVSEAAQATYTVTVKSTTTIAGIKALTNSSTSVSFSADLTDAVVTYVSEDYAYIQDASAAVNVYIDGHGLEKGQRINGAVSGTVKANYQIDQLTVLNLTKATVTNDGVIPAEEVKTLAEIKDAGANYDGKLVKIVGATINTGMSDALSGGIITDDNGTTKFYIIAPNRLTLVAKEKGNFTGFVSIYNGNTYRLNVYETSQFVKTHNVPQNQTLSFEGGNVVLDEDTQDYDEFEPKTVSGAKGTVTYAISGDEIYSGFNTSTGAFTLNGAYGTATITATAAATELDEDGDGVYTPYNEATKSYTVTVRPRYSVTFHINDIAQTVREANYQGGVVVPAVFNIDDYKFMGWSTSEVTSTNEKPNTLSVLASTIYPESNDDEYYAVFAKQSLSGSGGSYTLDYENDEVTCSGYGNEKQITASDGSEWVVKAYDNNGMQINKSKNSSIKIPNCPGDITTILVTCSTSSNNAVGFSSTNYTGSNTITYLAEGTAGTSQTLDLTDKNVLTGYIVPKGGAAIITNIVVNYGPAITYSDYRTSIPPVSVTVTSAKYATFSNAGATDFSQTGIKVYKAKVENEVVRLTEIEDGIVPAKTGVILYSETAVTTDVPFISNNTTISENELVATYERTLVKTNPEGDETKFNYIMQLSEDGKSIVFNKALADGAYMPAGRAYLCTSTNVTTASRLMVVFGDDASGIESTRMSNENVNGEVYNLKGQRVMNPAKGNLYIVNGKKVFIK